MTAKIIPIKGNQKRRLLSAEEVRDVLWQLLIDNGYRYNYMANSFQRKGIAVERDILKALLSQYTEESYLRMATKAEAAAYATLLEMSARSIMHKVLKWEASLSRGESDDALRQFLKLNLRPDITPEHFEFSVLSVKQWMWMVRRQLLDLPIAWHIAIFVHSNGQGTGKSTFVRRLVQPLNEVSYLDASFDVFKDAFASKVFTRCYVMFFDEMVAADRADISNLKKAVTRDTVMGRQIYSDGTNTGKAIASFIGATNNAIVESINDSNMRRFVELPWRNTRHTAEELAASNAIPIDALWGSVNPHQDLSYVQQNQDLFQQFQQMAAAEDFIQYYMKDHMIAREDLAEEFWVKLDLLHVSYSVYLGNHGTRLVPQLARLKAKLERYGVRFATKDKLTYCTSHVLIHEGEKT